MGLAGLQPADLLQMQQVGAGKGRGRVEDAAGMYQLAVKHGAVHRVSPPVFVYCSGKHQKSQYNASLLKDFLCCFSKRNDKIANTKPKGPQPIYQERRMKL